MAESTNPISDRRASAAANLFDLRRIIGGVFVVLGLLLTILGLFASDADVDRAAGVNINLWAGLGMLVFGILMLVWALTRPLAEQIGTAEPGEGEGPMQAPPPRGVDAAALASQQRRGRPGIHDERPVGPDDARPQ
jgi:hypothetical protein